MNKPTYGKLIPQTDGILRINIVQHLTPTSEKNRIWNKVLVIRQRMHTRTTKKPEKAIKTAIEGGEGAFDNTSETPEGKLAERKLCGTDEGYTHAMPEAY